MIKHKIKRIGEFVFLYLIQVVLFVLSWPTWKGSLFVLVFFVPMFLILEWSKTNRAILFNVLLYFLLFVLGVRYRCEWLTNTHVFGGILAFVILAISYFIPVLLFFLLKKISKWVRYIIFISSWLSIEYLYNTWELGFPYLDLGYILGNHSDYISFYKIIGVRGGSLFILICNVLFYDLVSGLLGRKMLNTREICCMVVLRIVIVILPTCYSVYETNKSYISKTVKVMVVHPHTPVIGFKYNIPVDSLIEYHIARTKTNLNENIDLVVWPEGAVTGKNYVYGIKDNNFERIHLFLDSLNNTAILTGATLCEEYSNLSVYDKQKPVSFDIDRQDFFLNYNGAIILTKFRKYDEIRIKEKLVPFDEKIPYPKLFLFLSKFIEPSGEISFVNRSISNNLLKFKEIVCFPSICYELMFSEYCREKINTGANLLVNLANEGWINDSILSESMLNIARVRAIENNRWVLKTTNQGVSAIIDNRGDVKNVSRKKVHDTLVCDVRLIETKTIYSKYGDLLGKISTMIAPFFVVTSLISKLLFRISRFAKSKN